MKKIIYCLSIVLLTFNSIALETKISEQDKSLSRNTPYQVGDFVENYDFLDSDGGTAVQRSFHDITADNKLLILGFGNQYCGSCVEGAPNMEIKWLALKEEFPENVHLTYGILGEYEWDNANGSSWRTKFNPPHTYYVSIHDELGNPGVYSDLFGGQWVPHYVVIGKDNILKHSNTEQPTLDELRGWVSEMSNIQEKSLPSCVTLYQNYPNPFNPQTTISFELNSEELVNLTVFDSKGSIVSKLINNQLTAGRYNVDFNGINLNSGVYYYTLNVNSVSETRKMLLLK